MWKNLVIFEKIFYKLKKIYKARNFSNIMNETLEIEKIEYSGKIYCKKCNKEFPFDVISPEENINCHYCNEYQTFKREDIERIRYYLISQTPAYSTSTTIFIDHLKKELIPEEIGAIYKDPGDFNKIERDVIELLKEKGKQLTKEDFWRGYTFIEDFGGII